MAFGGRCVSTRISDRLRLGTLSGPPRLATSAVPREVGFSGARENRARYRCVYHRTLLGRHHHRLGHPPSPGTGEGLRSKAQGEGGTTAEGTHARLFVALGR